LTDFQSCNGCNFTDHCEEFQTFYCENVKRRSMKLTSRLQPLPILRMSGAVPLLPLYAFMGHAGTTLNFIPYLVYFMVLNWPKTTQNVAILLCTLPMNRLPLVIPYELHVQPIVTLYWSNCSNNEVLNSPYISCCAQTVSFTLSKNLHYAKT